MVLSNIPHAISNFFAGVQDADLAALSRSIVDDTVLIDRGTDYRGIGELGRWLTDLTNRGKVDIHPINVARLSGTVIVTALVGPIARPGSGPADQLDWHFTIRGDKVAAISILQTLWPDMPKAVIAFIRATNAFDLSGVLNALADDALVNDQFKSYWGKSAIREWALRDVVGDRLTMYVSSATKHYKCTIVTANVDGEYEKSGLPDPLVLEFFFEVLSDKIIRLIILRHLG